MKLFNKIATALLALPLMAGLTACSDKHAEYTPAEQLSNAQVYFPTTLPTDFTLSTQENVLKLQIERVNTEGELVVPLTTTQGAESTVQITVPSSVKFADGQSTAAINATYDPSTIAYDDVNTIVITVGEESVTTPYGVSTYTFSASIPAPWTPWINSKAKWVASGYDAAAWPLSEKETTCTYNYGGLWSGADPGLPIYYRQSTVDPSQAQFRIDNWGGGISLYIDYNTETHKCTVPAQFTGYTHSTYGDVTVGDVTAWQNNGKDYSGNYPCTYDPATGLFSLNLSYFVPEGSFGGYDPAETCQVDGFYVPDYSVTASYLGIFTDKNENAYAQINVESLGADVETAKALVVSKEDDAAAVADAIAAGEVEATDVVVGYNNIEIGDYNGELQVVVVTMAEGELKDAAALKFEYYAPGAPANPWKSLGIGLYTEGLVSDGFGLDALTYECEIKESTENPGLYRVMDPYGDQWGYAGYNSTTPCDYLEINACDPDGVYIMPQMIGVNVDGNDLGIASYAGYFIANGQMTFEDAKANGYLGKVIDGTILLPTLSNGEIEFQGIMIYGTKAYYGLNNFKVVLPEAVTASAAKKAVKPARMHNPRFQATQKVDLKKVNKQNVHTTFVNFK